MTQPVYTVTLNPGLDRTLTVPAIQFNEVLRAAESRLDWGGKGFNVSRALKALGVASVAMGFVGGATGTMLERGLQSLGIETDFVRIEGETRTNTVFAETGSNRYIKVNEAGPAVSPDALAALLELVAQRVTEGSVWVLSGSLPPGVPHDVYARIIAEVQAGGGRACLDAGGEALRLGCAAGPHLVKPNAEEAQELTGAVVRTPDDAQGAVRYLNGAGAQHVALSLGADGLVYATGAETVHARPPAIEARTVVGVGDALLAGLVYAIRRGLSVEETARWGVAAGTAAAVGEGVSVGSLEEVTGLVGQVRVVSLA